MNFVYDLLEISLLGQSVIAEFSDVSARSPLRPPSMTAHYHDMWELILAHDDNLTERIGSRTVKLHKNDVVFISPGTRHCFTDMSMGAPVVSIFKLNISDTNRSNLSALLFSRAGIPIEVSDTVVQQIDEIKDIYSQWRKSGRQNYLLAERCGARLKLFLCDVIEAMLADKEKLPLSYKKMDFTVSNIIDYIYLGNTKDDKRGDITIERLANTIGYSVEHTERIIKKRYGKSFRTLMHENKIERAKSLLADQSASTKEIAEILSYKNQKSFSESFRRAVGKTPSEYRHECMVKKRMTELK